MKNLLIGLMSVALSAAACGIPQTPGTVADTEVAISAQTIETPAGGIPVSLSGIAEAERNARLDAIEQRLDLANRQPVAGWVVELRPGDRRSAGEVARDLEGLRLAQQELVEFPQSDRVGGLLADIRTAILEDCRSLLKAARFEQNIRALDDFIRYAQEQDVDLETDFGVKPADLRAEALKMAKKEAAELMPRVREGSGDAAGAMDWLIRTWSFSSEELGLTAKDMRILRGEQ